MKTKSVTLLCIAPDGAYVREGDFPSVEDAWSRASDMGSRWYFYPVQVVATSRKPRARLLDLPPALHNWKNKTVTSLAKRIAAHSDAVCAWLNNKAPLPAEVYFP